MENITVKMCNIMQYKEVVLTKSDKKKLLKGYV